MAQGIQPVLGKSASEAESFHQAHRAERQGERALDAPATPERVLAAIEEMRGRGKG